MDISITLKNTTIKSPTHIYRLAFSFICLFSAISITSSAQSLTTVDGIVVDASKNEPLAFVNVYFRNSTEGTTTDIDGKFLLKASFHYDSIVISAVGYRTQVLPVKAGIQQQLSIALQPDLVNLDEVIVMSGENPAWAIIRNAVKNKKFNDKRSLNAYAYQSYTRMEFDIENISPKLEKKKLMTDIWSGIDSASLEKNDNGLAVLPVFLSESISKYYVKNDPFARREEVQKTKLAGVAIEDGSMVSQLVGAAYQDYNFYQNWLRFLEKEFISPIADSWKTYYDYEIIDTVLVDQDICYQLELFPNRKEDPAFDGTIWITASDFALKKLDIFIDKSTDLNFIEKIELRQDLAKTTAGPWLPVMTDLKIDVSNLSKNTASIWIKSLNATSNWEVNDVKDKKFYTNEVFVAEDYNMHSDAYWDNVRPVTLTPLQLRTYAVIDTLVEIPRVKSMVDFVKLATTGYWRRGKFDIGPYLFAYAHNNFEGNAFRLGIKTNEYFNNKITLKTYLGYGTMDQQWKYGFTGSYIIKRKPWTEFRVQSSRDLEQLGLRAEELIDDNYIFYAATRWRNFSRPFYLSGNSISIQTEPAKGLMHKLTLKHEYYDPQFPFYYYENPGNPAGSELKSDLSSSTIKFSTRWARDEMFLQNGNNRVSLGSRRAPIIQLDYTYGFRDVLESDFAFHKIQLEFFQKLRLGGLGESKYSLNGGYIIGQVPYLLLENHIGNESMFYTTGAFNTMNYFEFVSDKYASLRYEHYFQGMIMNKIPGIRKLKWRLLGTANVLYGSLRKENIDIISPVDPEGNPTPGFNQLDPSIPYVELGYGIENIFKFIRVDGIHRITYRNRPEAQKFALKFSFQFKL